MPSGERKEGVKKKREKVESKEKIKHEIKTLRKRRD